MNPRRRLTEQELNIPAVVHAIDVHSLDADAGIDLLHQDDYDALIAGWQITGNVRIYATLRTGLIARLDANVDAPANVNWCDYVYAKGYDGAPLSFNCDKDRDEWLDIIGDDAMDATHLASSDDGQCSLHALATDDGELHTWLATNADPLWIDIDDRTDVSWQDGSDWMGCARVHVYDIRGVDSWYAARLDSWLCWALGEE